MNRNINWQTVEKFLMHSNAIEGEYDSESLAFAEDAWEYLFGQDKLTREVVLETHARLMECQGLLKKHKGAFRDCDVYIGGRMGVSPHLVPDAVNLWLASLENPETDWKEAHVEYERIHPFVDGNGRTGRMFMNWHRLKLGMPILVIMEGQEQYEYYHWFK